MSSWRKPLLITALVLLALVLLFSVLSWWLAPRFKDIAVREINAYLKVPVKVDDISFSLFRKFPYASVDFSGVGTKGQPTEGGRDSLLSARHIFLQFSLAALFSSETHIKRITIEDAVCILRTDRHGTGNFDIFRKRSGSGSSDLRLEEVELRHVTLVYRNLSSDKDFSFLINRFTVSGRFTEDIYEMDGLGGVFTERLMINGVNYLHGKEADLRARVRVNSRLRTYEFMDCEVSLGELPLTVKGMVRDHPSGTGFDLSISSGEAGLRQLLSAVPGVYTGKLGEFDYEGRVFFNLLVRGMANEKENPVLTAEFGTNNAGVQPKGTNYRLSQLKFKGTFTSRLSPSRPVERLHLNGLSGRLDGQPLSAELMLEDFRDPWLSLNIKSRFSLEVLGRFWQPDTIAEMKGRMLADVRIRGRANEPRSWISEGSVLAEQVAFSLRNSRTAVRSINGRINLEGNRLSVSGLSGMSEGSDFLINGSFDNVYGYLLSNDQIVSGSAELSSRNLDFNELLGESNKADSSFRLELSDRYRIDINAKVGVLTLRKFQAWQVKGRLRLDNKVITGEDISGQALAGNVKLSGRIDATRSDSMLIACTAELKRLDITELFAQFSNFGQEVLTDKNVKGKLTASVSFASTWSKDLHCNPDRVYARSRLTIENGELINFQPMMALSRYLKSGDLNHIRFATLQNEIEIKDQAVYFPAMEIRSSLMDLNASGIHRFNNQVDYKLQLYLSQVFGRKVRDKRTEFGEIEDDGLGRMRLFLQMKGPLSDPQITYDRKGIEQKITKDVKQEKQELKQILREEFGWFRKDTLKTKKTEKPKQEAELELDTEEP